MKKRSLETNHRFFIFVVTFLATSTFMYLKHKEGLLFISTILFIAYCYEIVVHRKIEWTNYIENLNKDIDIASHDAIKNMPTAALLLDSKQRIIWYNSKFLELSKNKRIINVNIVDIVPGLDIDKIDIETQEAIQIEYENRHYDVFYNILDLSRTDKNKDEHMTMLYFVDRTECVELSKRYIEEKVNIGLIYIDNYEELMDETDETTRFIVLAEVDRKLNLLSKEINGIIKKTDRNKYLMLFKDREKDMFKKFEILDEIRSIRLGNTIPVTLSMGIGSGDRYLRESYENARAAMDIALGRGGDQAVIKEGNELSFYGGSVQALEKRTKVKARVISYALKQLIDQSETVFIMGHKVGDMDSFGASIGIYRIAKNRGKRCFIVLNSTNPSIENIYEKLKKEQAEYIEDIVPYDRIRNMSLKSSICIVVDTHIPGQVESFELLERSEKIVVIDHHRRGKSSIKDPVLSYIETYASSTCELITEILYYIEENIYITEFDATSMLAGIAVDTKNFAVNTGVRTFETASFLRKRGADTLEVRKLFQNDLDDYRFKGDIIKNISIFKDSIAISKLEKDAEAGVRIAAQASDEILNLKDIKAVFVLAQIGRDIHISGRSTESINVQRILEKLGGGGHMTVAGARVAEIALEDVEDMLKKAITEYLEEGEDK